MFSQNWPNGSGKENRSCICAISLLNSLEKGGVLYLNKLESLCSRVLCTNLPEIGPVVLEKMIFFLISSVYFAWKRAGPSFEEI